MKHTLLAAVFVLTVSVLAACVPKGQSQQAETPSPDDASPKITVSFVQDTGEKADVWIIPDTEKNRKTSVWGTATIARTEPGKEAAVTLNEGTYLFRMIDEDEMYYEANGIVLKDGAHIILHPGEGIKDPVLEVISADGRTSEKYEVFWAAL